MAQPAIDSSDLRKFAKQIRQASRETGRELTKAEKAAAKVVSDRAREIMGEHSPKSAATIKPFAAGDKVGIQIGNDDVPLARLLEVGNSSSIRALDASARSGTFKHPVFATGDRSTWRWDNDHPQKMHPAVGPAVVEKLDEFERLLAEGVSEAFRNVRLYWDE